MPYFSFENSSIYYEQYGKGKPLLFLHGWNESIESFKKNMTPKLRDSFNLILLDLPGFGKSDQINLSFDNLYLLLDSLIHKLDLKELYLVGYCMGGIIALDYTIRNPQKVNKLILIKTFIDFPPTLYPLIIEKINYKFLNFLFLTKPGMAIFQRILLLRDRFYKQDFFNGFSASNRANSSSYLRLMEDYSKINHYERIKQTGKEIIMIAGVHTNPMILKMINKIKENYHKSKMIFLEKAGNFPIEENSNGLSKLIKSI